MISDANWKVWLQAKNKRRCMLYRLTFLGANASNVPTEFHAYVSNLSYISGPSDTPPNQPFRQCIVTAPTFTRVMGEQLTGGTQISSGDLIIGNANNERSSWLTMNWDGRAVTAWFGDPGWPLADFRIVMVGTHEIFDSGPSQIGFHLTDKELLLDRPVMVTLMGGTGPQAGELRPLNLGMLNVNIKPKVIDAVTYLYRFTESNPGIEVPYFNDFGSIFENPVDVRVGGVSLTKAGALVSSNPATGYLKVTAHGFKAGTRIVFRPSSGAAPPSPLVISNPGDPAQTAYWVSSDGLTAGAPDDFKVAATLADALAGSGTLTLTTSGSTALYSAYRWTPFGDGTFQLNARPDGELTCDAYGLAAAAGATLTPVSTMGGIAYEVLTSGITNTPFTAADIDATSLAAFKTLCAQSGGAYVSDTTTFRALLDALMLSVGAWRSWSRDGKMVFGRLGLPDALAVPVYTFTKYDMGERSLRLIRRILPRLNAKLKRASNWTVQTTLDGAVSAYDRALWGVENQITTSTYFDADWKRNPPNHINARRLDAFQTYLNVPGEVTTEAGRLATMFSQTNGIWAIECSQIAFALDIGSPVAIAHDKFTGPGVVVGIKEAVVGKSEVQVFTQLPNGYPSGDLL